MAFTTLLAPADLRPFLDDPDWAVIDCRFALDDPARGRLAYLDAHLPGALYAHLDDDLSGTVVPGRTGRHPLPAIEAFTATLTAWGIDDRVQVVAYDDAGGAFAARLWWMLRWLGHDAVAVLDGGWPRWVRAGYPTESGHAVRAPRPFAPRPRASMTVDADAVRRLHHEPSARLLDARAAARYRGEVEPIDPVAGHIPGALSAPYAENLDAEGCFLPPPVLRRRFDALLGDAAPEDVVSYCGSGVTAAHNLLALAHAGLDGARLYPGSWSEWITDPKRPVATL